jgi:hypothetical protein
VKILKTLAIVTLLIFSTSSFAKSGGGPSREKVIDFDDEVIEGMNKRPLDSLNQLSEKNKRAQKPHLYKKRGGFKSETTTTLREMRFSQ